MRLVTRVPSDFLRVGAWRTQWAGLDAVSYPRSFRLCKMTRITFFISVSMRLVTRVPSDGRGCNPFLYCNLQTRFP